MSKWTQFWDMHSGGGSKEQWDKIFIEAPEAEAKAVFYNRFGHVADRVSCTCCGEDYSVSECETLADATAFHRNDYESKYRKSGDVIALADYIQRPDVLVIYASEIKPEERKADLPRQGYVWCE